MKKSILILAIVLFAGIMQSMAQKQDHHMKTPEERAQMMTEKMTAKLDLSNEQAKKIYQINLETAQKMHVIKQNKTEDADKTVFRAQMKELHQNHQTQLKAVLNAAQLEKWEAMKEERKEKHGKHQREYKKGQHQKGEHKHEHHEKQMHQDGEKRR